MLTAERIIKELNLKPLPVEGGYYTETYRADENLPTDLLPNKYSTPKAICSAIFYLLTPDTKSNIHRLPTDEIFHFYLGDPVQMINLYPDGTVKKPILGQNLFSGHRLQYVVPKYIWQGSYLLEGGRFALMGTTMAPGFDFADYEPGEKKELFKLFPDQSDIISKLT